MEKIGLSNAEIEVYLTLLKLGSAPSNRVVRETDFRKSTVYDSIARLQEKGLVSFVIKDSKKYFEATEPERLIEFIHDKKRELDTYEKEVGEFVKKIEESFPTIKPVAEAQVLVGPEGFKTLRRDVLRNADNEIMLMGAVGKEYKVMPAFFKNWNKSRLMKGIKQRILSKESMREGRGEAEKALEKNFEIRFLPEELDSPAVINVYGDRVANIVWKEDYPICFLMINKETADSYRKYFNYLWKQSSL